VQGGISLDRYNLNNYNNNSFIFSDGISNNLSFSLSISRNSIAGPAAPLYPSRGSNISLTTKFTLPYSLIFPGRKNLDYTDPDLPDDIKYKWIEYHKWRFDVQWFAPISRNEKLVLMAQAKLGFLGLYNKELGYSPFERYEIGGDGLANNQFFIGRDIISQRGYQVYSPSTGAPIFNKYTLELRYPISLNPSATVYGLAFAEAGNYWNSPAEYNPFQLRRAFGAGIRVFLPMFGLLGFDYGIGFDGKPGRTGSIFSKYGEFRIILGFEPE
jgi:outer membrane protein insertion porin family